MSPPTLKRPIPCVRPQPSRANTENPHCCETEFAGAARCRLSAKRRQWPTLSRFQPAEPAAAGRRVQGGLRFNVSRSGWP
jgi:hypothetical protein